MGYCLKLVKTSENRLQWLSTTCFRASIESLFLVMGSRKTLVDSVLTLNQKIKTTQFYNIHWRHYRAPAKNKNFSDFLDPLSVIRLSQERDGGIHDHRRILY